MSTVATEWWRWEDAPTASEWSALLAGLTLAVAVVAAIVALVQYRSHLAAERSRTRPYVIVDYTFRSILMQIEIKNIGQSAATDVVLSVDPPFESGLRDQAQRLNAVFSSDESIAMLAPGRRILYTFDRAPDYYTAQRPERYTITATYNDLPPRLVRPLRRPWRKTPVVHVDTYPLDFRQWSQATAETDYAEKNWNIANRGEQREKRIVTALESIARSARSASQREPEPSFEYVVDTVQDSELAHDYALEHPTKLSQEDVPPGPKPKRRSGVDGRGPRLRWISRLD